MVAETIAASPKARQPELTGSGSGGQFRLAVLRYEQSGSVMTPCCTMTPYSHAPIHQSSDQEYLRRRWHGGHKAGAMAKINNPCSRRCTHVCDRQNALLLLNTISGMGRFWLFGGLLSPHEVLEIIEKGFRLREVRFSDITPP